MDWSSVCGTGRPGMRWHTVETTIGTRIVPRRLMRPRLWTLFCHVGHLLDLPPQARAAGTAVTQSHCVRVPNRHRVHGLVVHPLARSIAMCKPHGYGGYCFA